MAVILQPTPTAVSDESSIIDMIDSAMGERYWHLGSIVTPATVLALAVQLARLCGPSYFAGDGTSNAADFSALAAIAALQRAFGIANLGEAFPDSTTDLVAEWETMLGLTPHPFGTDDERRTWLLAKWRERFPGTPQGIGTALAPINDGTKALIAENSWSVVAPIDPRSVFLFAVRLTAATYADPAAVARARVIVDAMKPAHTSYTITGTQTDGFLCDDPNSLTDDTVLRA